MKKTLFLPIVLCAVFFGACVPGGTAATTEPDVPGAPTEDLPITDPIPKEDPLLSTPEPFVLYLKSTVAGLNIRSGPGTAYSSLGTLDKDDMVACIADGEDWVETVYRNKRAYVAKKYVRKILLPRSTEETERVVSYGCRYLGTPYVYGAVRLHDGTGRLLSAFSPEKFDCSSLMQFLFYYGKDALLSTTTRTQVLQGSPVPLSSPERGDLMFFTNASRINKTGIERIGHVALYLGEGYILHTASDHAVIEPPSPARQKNLLAVRRI